MLRLLLACALLYHGVPTLHADEADGTSDRIANALARAGKNRPALESALAGVPDSQRPGLEFLIAYMPQRDLESLSAEFLLENVGLAYEAWHEAPWKDAISEEIFLNEILPYATINERRDRWRRDFRERFSPLVKEATSPAEAAAILNQKVFPQIGVKYSTKRSKPDQSPYESMEIGMASCTGLSVILVDACRAVGVPARFAGTPRWADNSGNHSWVEVWDGRWHFTGAAEPTGDELDKSWFAGRASQAKRDDPAHAIFATSFKRTPQSFPLIWNRGIDDVFAVNVTDRYTAQKLEIPEGHLRVRFRVLGADGERRSVALEIHDGNGQQVFSGKTKDERFDANDHLTAILEGGRQYIAVAKDETSPERQSFEARKDEQLLTLRLSGTLPALEQLEIFLRRSPEERPQINAQKFAQLPLSKDDATRAQELLWDDHVKEQRRERAQEMKDRRLEWKGHTMPFHYTVFGEKPETGRSLYISMHGGGGAPARVNDQQWRNQQGLYQPEEGVYVAPRAPTNTWNLWHQAHIDPLFDRLIENMVIFEDVDPDRVYLMGYSAGGDGVYQLAPRMADRWAAVSMMAGHPNETSPAGLRNIGFALFMGGRDAAYKRNEVAKQWEQKLGALRTADPEGYDHLVKIFPDKGHWMDREDRMALPWMAKFRRNMVPERIVWLQDDVTHSRFYWLALLDKDQAKGTRIVAECRENTITLQATTDTVVLRLDDRLVDLDQPVVVRAGDHVLAETKVTRSIAQLARTLAERGDRQGMFSAELMVPLRKTAKF